MNTPTIADLLLNRPVRLPDGTVWKYRKRRSVEAAEAAHARENARKQRARAAARLKREAQA